MHLVQADLSSCCLHMPMEPICMLQFGAPVGWLVWVERPFQTVYQSISGRLPERGRKKREMMDEK